MQKPQIVPFPTPAYSPENVNNKVTDLNTPDDVTYPTSEAVKEGLDAILVGAGTGDVVGPSTSVTNEVALFNGTTGKIVKRATGSGPMKMTSGVFSALGLASTRGITKSVYISKSSDGRIGVGTPEDPLNVSGQLDEMWPSVIALNPSYVEFAKDTYDVSTPMLPIANCWINFNGATIKCTAGFGVNNVHRAIFSGGYATDYSYCTISGGILDGNINAQTATKSVLSAFLFRGSYNLAEWNVIKNFGSKSDTATEAFIGGFWASNVVRAYGNVIRNNVVTSIITANNGPATIFSNHGADIGVMDNFTKPTEMWQHGSRIINNTFHDIVSGTAAILCIELGAWSVGETIAGNNFHHVTASCIYTDTGSTWDNVIRDNYGEDVYVGIHLQNANGNSGQWFNKRLTIENNQMFPQLTSGVGWGFVVEQSSYSALKNIDFKFYGNKASTYWNGTVANVGIVLRGLSSGVVENNWADAAVGANTDHFAYDHCTNVLFRNNTARILYDGGNNTGIVLDGNVTAAQNYLNGPVDIKNRTLMASDNVTPMLDFRNTTTPGFVEIPTGLGLKSDSINLRPLTDLPTIIDGRLFYVTEDGFFSSVNTEGNGFAFDSSALDDGVYNYTLLNSVGTIPLFVGVPTNASAAGVAGTMAYASGFLYICTATNTWKRVAIATW